MRIVQLIDSLEAGGAERMAVNYANTLAKKITFSGLIATRKEGQLVYQINENVSYLFLAKRTKIDLKAIFRLRKYIAKNKIEVVHAHGSSFFTAVLVKLTVPKVRIIWHDHYGTRAKELWKENLILIISSLFFHSIFVVNLQLKEWSKRNMLCRKVFFIPNFTIETDENQKTTTLKGIEGKRIVFLANLRNPKNHILILKAFLDLKLFESGWSLHLIGKDYFDSYSDVLKKFIEFNSLGNHIHLHGERSDIKHVLSQASIGVLASTQEGFPVTLLEYAMANLAVMSTNAGYCSEIIQNEFSGLLFNPKNNLEVLSQFQKITQNEAIRKILAKNLKQSVTNCYSEEIVIEKLIKRYKK